MQPLLNQREVVEGVARLRVERGRRHQRAARLAETTQLEEDLALEGAVDRDLTRCLQAPSDQEERSLEVIEIEDGLGLEVMDLGLRGAIEPRKVGIAG